MMCELYNYAHFCKCGHMCKCMVYGARGTWLA